jgi:predicted metal-binding protein
MKVKVKHMAEECGSIILKKIRITSHNSSIKERITLRTLSCFASKSSP